MGYEYEVSVWKPEASNYVHCWSGDTLEEATQQMQKLRDEGYLCIRLEWRPE